MSRSWEERVGEYVDAPTLRMRLRSGKSLSCRIRGNFGVYATSATVGRKTGGTCTCPADDRPCKHIEALRRTYRANRASFADLDKVLDELSRQTKAELLEVVRDMALRAPQALAVLAVDGFDDDAAEEDEDEWLDEGPVISIR